METVKADITLKNAGDVSNAQRGIIKDSEIRQLSIRAMVDTGAITLVINDEVRKELGLELVSPYEARLADGVLHTFAKSEPIQVYWKNREMVCQAIVVPDAKEVLLGLIPLESMDLIVHPSKNELVGAHGDEMIFRI